MLTHRSPGVVHFPRQRKTDHETYTPEVLAVQCHRLGCVGDSRRLNAMPLPVRVLARRRNLPPWRAIAIAEISGFGGLSNDR